MRLLYPDKPTGNEGSEEYANMLETSLLDVLNSGGARSLLDQLRAKDSSAKHVGYEDLTNDTVPEFVVTHSNYPLGGKLYVFGCIDGKYQTLLVEKSLYEESFPEIVAILDTNLDGVKELVIHQVTCHWCDGFRVYEWDGEQFQSLVRRWMIDPDKNELSYLDYAEIGGLAGSLVVDTDGNGTYEILLQGGTPSYSAGLVGDDGPWREQTITYMWDGQYFVWHSRQFAAPQFRFEAVQDADLASIQGDFEGAQSLYQAVIFSDTLKSWTLPAWQRLLGENSGYPDITHMPFDQTEYDQLAAYARFRILLLHELRGWDSDARVVYETLQQKYPLEKIGHEYAELATEFWTAFQATRNIEQACQAAIAYATVHEEILAPLGSYDHGVWSLHYAPGYVCPFTGKE